MWHIFKNGWEDKEFIKQRVYGFEEARKEIDKWNPEEVERVSGVPGAQLERVAKTVRDREAGDVDLVAWARPSTRSARPTSARAACCCWLTGNVGKPGTGANIIRGHDNVQGATDIGVDTVTLPFYYGLSRRRMEALGTRLGSRLRLSASRFDSKKMMETPGIPLTRWFDAVLLPKDQVDQKDNVRAMFVQGHASNSITRIPESMKALPKLDLLVVADPHPTTWASLAVEAGRKDNMYLLPVCTQFETSGSRVASNRSLQWGEPIVPPSFESKDDYQVLYLMAKKLGFADLMFKNIKVEGDRPVPEDVLREMNRGSWSTGYTGQSPERLKAHMRNQHKFDLVTLRAPKDDPEVGGDYYGLPWPCWGTPEVRHPGSPILYNADAAVMDGGNGFRARFGVGAQRPDAAGRRLLSAGFGDQGRLSRVHDGRSQEARLGQGSDARKNLRSSRRSQARPAISIRCRGRPIFPAAYSALRSSMAVRLTATPRRGRLHGTCPIRFRSIANRSTRRASISLRSIRRCPTRSSSGCRISALPCRRRPWTKASPSSSR